MDHDRFDCIARALGAGATRRAGLRAALGGLLGLGAASAALDADAKGPGAKRGNARPGAARRRKHQCGPSTPCPTGFACVKQGRKRRCACSTGVTCNGACCPTGQVCRNGACVVPTTCIAPGEPCKGVGKPCCDGRTCASGQGGEADVSCYVPKTGACASTADCVFGTACQGGACVGNGGMVPTGAPCGAGSACAQPGAVCTAYTTSGAPGGDFCTLPLRKVCEGHPDCTCYNCWYVRDGVPVTSRRGRNGAPVKACIQPVGGACAIDDDCARGLTCDGASKTCVGTQCAPAGAPCGGGVACCQGSTCEGGTCSGGGTGCTVESTNDPVADGVTLKNAIENASDGATITVGPGTYKPVPTGSQLAALVISKNLTIEACDPNDRPTVDGGNTVTGPTTDNAKDLTWGTDGNRIVLIQANKTVTIDGINMTNGNAENDANEPYGGALMAVQPSTVTLKNLSVTRSTAGPSEYSYGGAIFADANDLDTDESRSLTLDKVSVMQCRASYAGALYASGVPLTISGTATSKSTFSHNYAAEHYGAISCGGDTDWALPSLTVVTLSHVVISSNRADGFAGGISLEQLKAGMTSSITDTEISGNTAVLYTGGLELLADDEEIPLAETTLERVTIQNNVVTSTEPDEGFAGGLYIGYGTTVLGDGVSITGNRAKYGSGVVNRGASNVTCTAQRVSGNTDNDSPTFTPAADGQTYADCWGGGNPVTSPNAAHKLPAGCCATNAPSSP